jgi:O-antigen/teichoic acid export membrane protein
MFINIIANIMGRLWGTLSNFLFIPLYIHYLGFERFSIISFTLVVAGLMMMVGAGVTATLSREFAHSAHAQNEKIRILKTLESGYLVLVLFCIFLMFLTSDFIAREWLTLDGFSQTEIAYLLKIIGLDASFQLLIRFYMGGLLGLEKHVAANAYQIGWGMLRNGFVVIAIIFVPTLEVFFIWQCLSSLIFAILLRLSLYKLLAVPFLNLQFKMEREIISRTWRFAFGMLLISLVAGINTQLDKLIIGIYLPIEELGYYTLSISLAMGLVVIVNPISAALLPRFTALFSSGKTSEATTLFNAASLYVAILIFTFMSNMIFNAQELLWIWTGRVDLASRAYIYLPILAISMAMLALQIIPYSIAVAKGYTKLSNILGLFSLLITLPGYWMGTIMYGAMGAAVVFCIVQTTTTFIFIYFINNMFIKNKNIIFEYLKIIFFPLFITLAWAYSFSLISIPTGDNRIISLIWIGTATLSTFILSAICLEPIRIFRNINVFVQKRGQ